MSEISQKYTDVERVCNIANSIPVVAILTTALTATAWKVHMLGALSVAAGAWFLSKVTSSADRKWEQHTEKALHLALHSLINVFKTYIEGLLAWTFVGTVLLLTARFVWLGFEPKIGYDPRDLSPQFGLQQPQRA